MLNIFNLFLFLFTLWIALSVASNHISALYIFFGFIASSLVVAISLRLKLIEKKSEMLFLSFGFYRHFFRFFFHNFFRSMKLLFDLAMGKSFLKPTVHYVKIDEKDSFNPALLMASLNMSAGLFAIGLQNNEIMIHAIDEIYFKKFDFKKTCASLHNVNDDNLIYR